MGGVDKIDMVISTIESVRKSYKWYKKFFCHLLDISIWSACVLYKCVSNEQLQFATFYLRLIKQIFRTYLQTSRHTKGKEIVTMSSVLWRDIFQVLILIRLRKKTSNAKMCGML